MNSEPTEAQENPNEEGKEKEEPNEDKSNEPPKVILYRCHQCRVPLFKSTDIIPHQATKVRKFATKRQTFSDDQKCTSFFIEQPKWLNALGRMSDTIYCPKCNYKVGHFSWKGVQCSCGEWVKPSFQIPYSRVDAI
ncbi:dual specificity protein phosphatase 12 [Histomonas meleagridis]|uniref:dual specificity protein phosphatase 12 n=1 Tax=Histomonas meleagridis TaxID=135588 RepID=UPI00355A0B9C|nr:dual specificity protein phosphatase 12 [Histomonas meleagridis]KAH0801396.1 dual specificity protein phosphatase 12 [Histomonas meleagridis]